ncbi:type II toxin-antitoxin system RelB family antitoxin [Shinella sp.]|uniref:type II toxin-antitoxin system RelB family antitoxin n=1 Tax=Shinella sp. TaxID=1870904 RepID=UPI003F72CA01
MLDLRLPADIEKRLEDLARKTGRSTSYFVREAIVEHLDDLEDLYLAEERLRELQSGETGTIALADLMKIHGMEN